MSQQLALRPGPSATLGVAPPSPTRTGASALRAAQGAARGTPAGHHGLLAHAMGSMFHRGAHHQPQPPQPPPPPQQQQQHQQQQQGGRRGAPSLGGGGGRNTAIVDVRGTQQTQQQQQQQQLHHHRARLRRRQSLGPAQFVAKNVRSFKARSSRHALAVNAAGALAALGLFTGFVLACVVLAYGDYCSGDRGEGTVQEFTTAAAAAVAGAAAAGGGGGGSSAMPLVLLELRNDSPRGAIRIAAGGAAATAVTVTGVNYASEAGERKGLSQWAAASDSTWEWNATTAAAAAGEAAAAVAALAAARGGEARGGGLGAAAAAAARVLRAAAGAAAASAPAPAQPGVAGGVLGVPGRRARAWTSLGASRSVLGYDASCKSVDLTATVPPTPSSSLMKVAAVAGGDTPIEVDGRGGAGGAVAFGHGSFEAAAGGVTLRAVRTTPSVADGGAGGGVLVVSTTAAGGGDPAAGSGGAEASATAARLAAEKKEEVVAAAPPPPAAASASFGGGAGAGAGSGAAGGSMLDASVPAAESAAGARGRVVLDTVRARVLSVATARGDVHGRQVRRLTSYVCY